MGDVTNWLQGNNICPAFDISMYGVGFIRCCVIAKIPLICCSIYGFIVKDIADDANVLPLYEKLATGKGSVLDFSWSHRPFRR